MRNRLVLTASVFLAGASSLSAQAQSYYNGYNDGAVVRCVKDGRGGTRPGDVYETAIFFTNLRETDRAALEEFVQSVRRTDQVA